MSAWRQWGVWSLVALLVLGRAFDVWAQGSCYGFTGPLSGYSNLSATAVMQHDAPAHTAPAGYGHEGESDGAYSCTPDTATVYGAVATCTRTVTHIAPTNWYCSNGCTYCGSRPGGTCEEHQTATLSAVGFPGGSCPPGPPPNACASKRGQDAFIGASVSPGLVCDAGCEADATNPPMVIGGKAATPTVFQTIYTGNSCSSAEPAAQTGQCVSGGGVTACATGSPKNCGVFNGDEVCPTAIPPGTCESYASGGVACTASPNTWTMPTPPGPNTGTAGQPATPSGHVQQDTVTNGEVSTYQVSWYFNAATVQASTQPVQGSAGAGTAGSSGSSGGSSGGSGDGKGNAGTECGNGTVSDGAGGCVADSASGGNDCSAPPACAGDAVECRILFETWASRCETLPQGDQLTTAVGLTPTSQAPHQLGLNPDASTAIDVQQVFSAGDHGGWMSRSCPADQVVSLGTYGSLTIPISDKCWAFQLFGTLVLVIAYFVAARIIVEGF